MEFIYETLGDEKFQKLCQTILVDRFPNVQCLPVGQPDGGRDAFSRQDGGLIIFQVKFVRQPGSREQRDAIASLIAGERNKVEKLIARGATSYYLLTNVSGTSHLDSGSIDRVNDELTEAFGIPSYVWWRDDIDRRIEASRSILWRYPELARGQDFLEFFAKEKSEQDYSRATRAFTAYMQTQHTKESDVKFQQVQIQSSLLDLFTDTPIGQAREKFPSKAALSMNDNTYQTVETHLQNRRHSHFDSDENELLAADSLLDWSPTSGLQRIVLEGAPGQGKSTVTQYLCQLHRTVALKKDHEIDKIPPAHRNATLRLPMRVDLRDYAHWLTGKDPMAGEKNVSRPPQADDSLESLISYQVQKLSGGGSFTIEDLHRVLEESHAILVLDGFDEVADIGTRSKIIEQSRYCGDRLSMVCRSLQVIVTSRPAAFILSPGFPEKDWAHLALLPMRRQQITRYADRWIKARGLPPKDSRDFKDLLLDRIKRPHIRSLAQNPMQLAILLNLVSTKGMSLPDKRTALYDSYMDLFFGREAEKDETVRENRDILFQIHQYVAWMLQLDAEKPGGTGSISQSELQELVKRFLSEKEHKGDVLKLFTGAVERVGALVSRVQGMLEFEVQPLREYFAGKYLYETAPYSPPGAERRGTKPERFAGLARRPYWSNVLRFYAGCYSSGELLSLVDGLEDLAESGDFFYRVHTIQLSLLLLADYVFAQEPKTVRKVVELVTRGPNLRYLAASRPAWEEGRLSLPENCGRSEIARVAYAAFNESIPIDFAVRLGAIIRLNSPLAERLAFWNSLSGDQEWHMLAARALGLFDEATSSTLDAMFEQLPERALREAITCGRWDELSLDQRVSAVCDSVSSNATTIEIRHEMGRRVIEDPDLYRVYLLLNPTIYAFLAFNRYGDTLLARLLSRFGFGLLTSTDEDTSRFDERGLNDIIHACARAANSPVASWSSELTPWSDIIESGRRTWGDTIRINTLAAVAAGIKSKHARASGFDDLLDKGLPLAERARHARLRSSASWWESKVVTIDRADGVDRHLVLLLLLAWAPASVIVALADLIDGILVSLDDEEFNILFDSLQVVVSTTSRNRSLLAVAPEMLPEGKRSPRFLCAIARRLPRSHYRKLLYSLVDSPPVDDRIKSFLGSRMISEMIRDPKLSEVTLNMFRHFGVRLDHYDSFQDDMNVFYGRRESMIEPIAKLVVDEPDFYPIRILELAENTFASKPADGLVALGDVASDERWFE